MDDLKKQSQSKTPYDLHYDKCMKEAQLELTLPLYLYEYVKSLSAYNDMSVDQVLIVTLYQMYANDMLSGVPTDFGHLGYEFSDEGAFQQLINPKSLDTFLDYMAWKYQETMSAKADMV